MVCVRVALAVALAGCVSSQAEVCPDGTLCAGNTICDERPSGGYRCLTEEQQAACNGLEEGVDCSIGDQPGACRDGSCELFFCGDGYLTAGEACDRDTLGMNGEGMINSCLDAGFYAREGLRCKSTCVFDTSQCTGGTCGDDLINGPELCDGDTNRTCLSIGFDAGNVT
ncbi:MAG: hypothetical protein H0T46_29250 [Deltaproteobacteria bacterium]|nr:hypothetical protein [Deltaproteobacteria bacterium]